MWIDNAAAMCTTASAVVHLFIVSYCHQLITINYSNHMEEPGLRSSRTPKKLNSAVDCLKIVVTPSCYILHFISGVFFGGFTLNGKISCLALLPFLVLTSIFALMGPLTKWNSEMRVGNILSCIYFLLSFAAGVICGHGPWVYIYWSYTGRMIPNAWPSKTMLKNSPYVRHAVEKKVWTYLTVMFEFSPVHIVGLASAFPYFTEAFKRFYHFCSWENNVSICMFILLVWPLSFIAGLTALGSAGAGFQSRFLLPALPATSILVALSVYPPSQDEGSKSFTPPGVAVAPLIILLMLIGTLHYMYYTVLYPTLFADFHVSVVDVLGLILRCPLKGIESRSAMTEMSNFMSHHGINLTDI